MSVIDGGSFKCYETEDKTMHYETVDPKSWEEHRASHNTESGHSPCAICGNIAYFQRKPIGKKALCDKCREELTS